MDLSEIPQEPFQRHPWEMARARFFVRLLEARRVLNGRRMVLDVGAGDGYVARELLRRLADGSRIVCYDAHYNDQHLAELGGSFASSALSFMRDRPRERFDLILLLDVLEHVPDDVGFLIDIVSQNLKPRACVVVSVPAWQGLFTLHDVALGHYRRYRPSDIARVVEKAELTIVARGGLFHALLLPRTLQKVREIVRAVRYPQAGSRSDGHARTDVGRWRGGRLLTAGVEVALAFDNACSQAAARVGLDVPGLSAWVLARNK
jgi:2-polyprenyl-3-methyl-5-hydroxy-6-metoxy-1,4-benzoquinol methylase